MNLETKEKTHVKGTGVMCPMDGYVVFRRSELLCGRLGKVTLGGSNKSGLFQVFYSPVLCCLSYIRYRVYCVLQIPPIGTCKRGVM